MLDDIPPKKEGHLHDSRPQAVEANSALALVVSKPVFVR